MRRLAPFSLLLLAAGCGGGGGGTDPQPAQRTPTGTPPASRGGDGERREAIIRAWSDSLRRSDVDRASRYFAVPVVVSQGRPVRLGSEAGVRAFNAALPCGARLVGAEPDGRYVVGTFRLTERPGKRCDAPGALARVAFVFEGDRFSEWRQVPEGPDARPGPDAPEPEVPDAPEPEAPSDAQAA